MESDGNETTFLGGSWRLDCSMFSMLSSITITLL